MGQILRSYIWSSFESGVGKNNVVPIFSPFKLSAYLCTTSFNIPILRFLPTQTVFVCSIWFSQQTAAVSLNSINQLGFVAET
jgi:hypothetical protein